MRLPFHRKFDEIFRGDRSTWLKGVCGVVVAAYITGSVFLRQEKSADRTTYWRVAIIGVVFAAIAGGLIAFLLTMKDRVKQRLARGERVNLLARAYLGMGIWSLLLWCPTVFFLGIATICSISVVQNMLKRRVIRSCPRSRRLLADSRLSGTIASSHRVSRDKETDHGAAGT